MVPKDYEYRLFLKSFTPINLSGSIKFVNVQFCTALLTSQYFTRNLTSPIGNIFGTVKLLLLYY